MGQNFFSSPTNRRKTVGFLNPLRPEPDWMGGTSESPEDLSSEFLEKPEAEVPVPDRLLPKGRSQELVFRLKLSQKIGLLLFLNRDGLLSEGGKERLLYLQRKASEEALIAGMKFSTRLSREKKLQSDFRHQIVELNRRPQSKRFRTTESRRIGVGYRDKGTLPAVSSRARREASSDNWVPLQSFPDEVSGILETLFPQLVEDEEFDLSGLPSLKKDGDPGIDLLLNRL